MRMDSEIEQELGDAERIAMRYTSREFRAKLSTVFALDRRLAQLVAQTSEPMLGQMRLAWWRDVLAQPADARPSGDTVLDAIGRYWDGEESSLVQLVDGWEHMLSEPPLGQHAARAFIAGRVEAVSAIYDTPDARLAARRWACADATAHTAQADERQTFIEMGLENAAQRVTLPTSLRGLSVLNALALRALRRNGKPLMHGRGAAATILRVSIIGR
ncbi:15-cis-phytoene synthase [Altererythrobacter insulae]|nr:15-cis-phytoene synthase [Altererythrobacter insulae]